MPFTPTGARTLRQDALHLSYNDWRRKKLLEMLVVCELCQLSLITTTS